MKVFANISIQLCVILIGLIGAFVWYNNSLIGVQPKARMFYSQLKDKLRTEGYKANVYVISGVRPKLFNLLLVKFGNAVKTSTHLRGEAIDILVLDINNDGNADVLDVEVVHHLLDREIVKNEGGVGTYKKQNSFFSQQMIHFDCRGYRARWNK